MKKLDEMFPKVPVCILAKYLISLLLKENFCTENVLGLF